MELSRLEILNLAHDAQLMRWAKEFDILQERPTDSIALERAPREWSKLLYIESLIKIEEVAQS